MARRSNCWNNQNKMSAKLYIKTYGCQMNVYDSERMEDVLKPFGYESVETPEGADLIILNTCHIREKAAEKVYSDIGRMKRLVKGDKGTTGIIAVAGCVGQAEGAEIMRRAPAVDLVLGPQTYHRLPALLQEVKKQRRAKPNARVLDTDFPEETKFDLMPRLTAKGRSSAFVTIQEGCDKFCTFCVVPYTRGSEYSRPVEAILNEAMLLVLEGIVEITLLGQNVNAYHGETAKGMIIGLGDLIRRLGEIEGLQRIRYTTSHPRDMDDSLITAHRDVAACMPYLHLPVQSGSDRVLKAMNRQHSADDYRRVIERLRHFCPDIALSGDFIVGFPGESDADFDATLRLVDDIGYAQAYSFKYSPRPGTPGATMGDQVDENVKAERLARLQEKLNLDQRAFNKASIGRSLPVLFERVGRFKDQLVGRSPYMQAVHVTLPVNTGVDAAVEEDYTSPMGQITSVEIVGAGPHSLEGRI
jgi:tRNA-2-methylthio-N6-dimethylallyladenosine synthase